MGTPLILKYFPHLTDLQISQFEKLDLVYREWNDRINVISRKDIDHLFERHVLHSLAIAKFQHFTPGTKILDVGTGGGFPGIPLAIFFPECEFMLVDSIGKKIKVVEQVVSATQLQNTRFLHERAEKLKEKFDVVVSRAVAPTKILYQWTYPLINRKPKTNMDTGLILLKGGDLDQELKELKRPHALTELSDYFEEPFFESKKLVFVPV